MSVIFLIGVFNGTVTEPLTNEYFYAWALFSIADAMWARVLFKR